MFARVKKSGKNHYLQIVENRKIKGKVVQRVIATIGRMDQLKEKDRIETLIRSLSRFSEKVLLILSGKSDVREASSADAFQEASRPASPTSSSSKVPRALSSSMINTDPLASCFFSIAHPFFINCYPSCEGSRSLKEAPPRSLWPTSTDPPCSSATVCTTDKPSPVPLPTGLVV